MSDLVIVDVAGNIYVHTQVGVKIPIVDQDQTGTPYSLAGKVWTLKTPLFIKTLATNPVDPNGLVLEITVAEAQKLTKGQDTPFVVVDETGEERWSGNIKRRGW